MSLFNIRSIKQISFRIPVNIIPNYYPLFPKNITILLIRLKSKYYLKTVCFAPVNCLISFSLNWIIYVVFTSKILFSCKYFIIRVASSVEMSSLWLLEANSIRNCYVPTELQRGLSCNDVTHIYREIKSYK